MKGTKKTLCLAIAKVKNDLHQKLKTSNSSSNKSTFKWTLGNRSGSGQMMELPSRTTLKPKPQLFTQMPQNSTQGLKNNTNHLTSSNSTFPMRWN
ncbi:hypothetical protein H5410_050369 [Solanum commersonii]|uniref:Uncharacterized protein n=1 Tax=Solanum commersonii TaxID=4109 RepID=A0A9J5WXR9_SOLCO|nr:hypothetical protein H5410_050369 [Solanum commersonii]